MGLGWREWAPWFWSEVPIGFQMLVGRINLRMSYPDRIGQAKERMLEAEAELDRCLQGGSDKFGQIRDLSESVKAFRNEYLYQLEAMLPAFYE
jgi:hypothetical protein